MLFVSLGLYYHIPRQDHVNYVFSAGVHVNCLFSARGARELCLFSVKSAHELCLFNVRRAR